MSYIAIDLGTTNIKVAVYDQSLHMLCEKSKNVTYIRQGNMVEFNAGDYFEDVRGLIAQGCQQAFNHPDEAVQIVLTGQAESLVVLDKQGRPIRNGISWLDMRSENECEALKAAFDADTCFRITGQPAVIPTWPITKMLWLKRHEPEVFDQTGTYLMLKDYILYCLTGKLVGEYSIYNFTHYFDVTKKTYWKDILAYCGVREDQLPPLVEPCTNIGAVKPNIARSVGINAASTVNVGTLDHFSGMIGTGNIKPGLISETTGTVLAIATMITKPSLDGDVRIPCHYGPFKDTYVLLPVCESGGVSLEWFKKAFMTETTYKELNDELTVRNLPNELLFLPYITGVNAPDFDEKTTGVFYGIQLKHDKVDFAYAIMEGIAHIFNVNISHMKKIGVTPQTIISTGGGAKSDIWSQMKADISGSVVAIPKNEETACLGAAMIGAVHDGVFASFEDAVKQCVFIKKQFKPSENSHLKSKHALFNELYHSLQPVFHSKKNNL